MLVRQLEVHIEINISPARCWRQLINGDILRWARNEENKLIRHVTSLHPAKAEAKRQPENSPYV